MDWLRSKGSNASAPSPKELLFLWQLGKLKKACPLPTPTLFIMPRRQEGVPSTQYLLQKLKVCTLEKETEPTANVSLHSKGGTGRVEKNRGRSIKRRGQEGGKRAGRREEGRKEEREQKEANRKAGLTPSLATSSCFSAFCFLML